MKFKVTSVLVEGQVNALTFYAEILEFQRKRDILSGDAGRHPVCFNKIQIAQTL